MLAVILIRSIYIYIYQYQTSDAKTQWLIAN